MKKVTFIDRAKGKPFIARDGALIFELFRKHHPKVRNLSIAVGTLKPTQKAIPHYHKHSEEIYFVLSGNGKVRIGEITEKIHRGEAIYIPKRAVCALQNTSRTKKLEVLAISSPPYSDSDIIFK